VKSYRKEEEKEQGDMEYCDRENKLDIETKKESGFVIGQK
jgi:hypothetical protein